MYRLIAALFIFSFFACSENTEQAEEYFDDDSLIDEEYFSDTVNYVQILSDTVQNIDDLAELFNRKYVSMYFDEENYLVITLRSGGVHFFDPHDSLEVADVLRFKQFIEFRDTIIANHLQPVSPFILQQKIDSLLNRTEY